MRAVFLPFGGRKDEGGRGGVEDFEASHTKRAQGTNAAPAKKTHTKKKKRKNMQEGLVFCLGFLVLAFSSYGLQCVLPHLMMGCLTRPICEAGTLWDGQMDRSMIRIINLESTQHESNQLFTLLCRRFHFAAKDLGADPGPTIGPPIAFRAGLDRVFRQNSERPERYQASSLWVWDGMTHPNPITRHPPWSNRIAPHRTDRTTVLDQCGNQTHKRVPCCAMRQRVVLGCWMLIIPTDRYGRPVPFNSPPPPHRSPQDGQEEATRGQQQRQQRR